MNTINMPPGCMPLGLGFAYKYETRSLFLNGAPVDLTNSELNLFDLCLRYEGTVVPYETIVSQVWHGKVVADSTRRGLYYRLRSKLHNQLFETVNGMGCRVRLPDNREAPQETTSNRTQIKRLSNVNQTPAE